MAYISFGNKELFEFVNPEKYLQRILSWQKKTTVRFEKPRWKCQCGWKGIDIKKHKPCKSIELDPFEMEVFGESYNLRQFTPTTRFEVGDIFDPYWRVRVPSGSKEWISFGVDNKLSVMDFGELIIEANRPPFYSWNYADRIMVSSHAEPNIEVCWRPAHNLSDIIGKAVITDVCRIIFRKNDGEIEFCSPDAKFYEKYCQFEKQGKRYSHGMAKFAKEDGFDSYEQFEGYFGNQLKEGESRTGVVYEYRRYEE